jgi:hypothetical protein
VKTEVNETFAATKEHVEPLEAEREREQGLKSPWSSERESGPAHSLLLDLVASKTVRINFHCFWCPSWQ